MTGSADPAQGESDWPVRQLLRRTSKKLASSVTIPATRLPRDTLLDRFRRAGENEIIELKAGEAPRVRFSPVAVAATPAVAA